MLIYKSLHHSGAGNTGKRQLNAVNEYHRQKWNMMSISGWYVGYNYFCDVDGVVTKCREEGEETMAQVGHNNDTISFCIAGNFNQQYPNERQIASLAKFLNEHPNLQFRFHRDLQNGRICPGSNITDEWIKKNVLSEDAEKQQKILTLLQKKMSLLQLLYKLLFNGK